MEVMEEVEEITINPEARVMMMTTYSIEMIRQLIAILRINFKANKFLLLFSENSSLFHRYIQISRL